MSQQQRVSAPSFLPPPIKTQSSRIHYAALSTVCFTQHPKLARHSPCITVAFYALGPGVLLGKFPYAPVGRALLRSASLEVRFWRVGRGRPS